MCQDLAEVAKIQLRIPRCSPVQVALRARYCTLVAGRNGRLLLRRRIRRPSRTGQHERAAATYVMDTFITRCETSQEHVMVIFVVVPVRIASQLHQYT